MSILRRSQTRALGALLLILVALGCAAEQAGAAGGTDALQSQIGSGQAQIGSLSAALSAASARLSTLNGNVAAIESRVARVEAQLSGERQALLALRAQSIRARSRLAALESFQAQAERTLAAELISAYESDRPDVITVVLESRGFNDLLERLNFAARVRRQTVRITTNVRSARRAVAAQAIRLGALEQRQQALTGRVLVQRDALDHDRSVLVGQQLAAARLRDARAGALAGARDRLAALSRQLAQLQAAQAAHAAQAAQAAAAAAAATNQSGSTSGTGSGGVPASPPASSGGAPSVSGFTFPLPKSAASPPGTWSLDQGVDISAPGDTPEYAVCSGTIVLHGIGGFGPWAPVLHCDSSLGGYSYVYYGHAGPANQLAVGTHVSSGEVMSSVGPGIVGISTGPHIEIGFADASGSPAGGASTMMSLLQGSY